MKSKNCSICGKIFYKKRRENKSWKKAKFCSMQCLGKEFSVRYKKLGIKPPTLYGKNHPQWKGGISNKKRKLRLRFNIFQRDDYTCQYCGRKSPKVVLEIDHKYPKIRGGKLTKNNCITACQDCNQGKKDIILNEFTGRI